MFLQAYRHAATHLVTRYTGATPFAIYLKHYFSENKKFGARDRRYISQLCYNWFRAAHGFAHLPLAEQFAWATFLCSATTHPLLQQLDETLATNASLPLTEKIAWAFEKVGFNETALFPWQEQLSEQVDGTALQRSLLVQPDLFLRLRPGRQAPVVAALQAAGLPFQHQQNCVRLPNNTPVQGVVALDSDAVVQDKNSQRVLELLPAGYGLSKKLAVWDCCAASGGKSILAVDTLPKLQLTVSDVRESILHNLRARFMRAGITSYRSFKGDVTTAIPPQGQTFDLVICDAPCSGSGTWARTPESLHTFAASQIDTYAQLQRRMVAHVPLFLRPGGLLLYITCSVFKKENEAVAESSLPGMGFLKSAYFTGYADKADTLFAALFQKL